MPKTHSSQPFIKWVAVAAVLAILSACGGGGSNPPPSNPAPTPTPTPVPDTTPADVTFTLPQATYAPGAVATTEEVSITDIDTPVDIAISAGGEYSINGGSFTSDAGQIADDQTLVARATAGSNFGDEVEITVTIGTATESFTVVTEPQDTQPEAFAPAAPETGVLRTTAFTFPEFTVAGITGEVDISITNGVYAVNDGEFGSDAATVSDGDTVVVRVTAASEFSTTTSATLTIGTGEGVFTVESEAEDFNPDAFDLGEDATVSAPGETAESQIVTIAGINSPASISIEGGEYRIVDVQEYESSPSTVAPGQQVQVRVTAASQINTPQTATLLIGDQSDTFSLTATDRNPPTAEVVFPTATTMSDGDFVTLRGTATDDFGPVTQIEVTVTTDDGTLEVDNQTLNAATGEDFQDTWSVQVDLASEKLNTIEVFARDAAGNTQQTPVTLTVLQKADALTTNFPEGNDEHITEFPHRGLAFNKATQTLYLPSYGSDAKILQVDITTGLRSEFLPHNPDVDGFAFMRIFPEENALFFGDQVSGNAIYRADLGTKEVAVVTDADSPDSDIGISFPLGMRLGSDGLLYAVDASDTFFSVDLATGARTLVSGSTRPDGGANMFDLPTDLWLDETNNRALISGRLNAQLTWVDLQTGERNIFVDSDQLSAPFEMEPDLDENRILLVDVNAQSLLAVQLDDTANVATVSGPSVPVDGANSLQYPFGLAVDSENNIAFVVTNPDEGFSSTTGVLLIDVTTGERIIVTNSSP